MLYKGNVKRELASVLIYAAGCGGGAGGGTHSGGSGSTGFVGGYDYYKQKRDYPASP